MTFLEYVCEQLLGPPTESRGDGQSQWPCPKCNHRSFHSRPHKPPYADKFSCFHCQWWGDEHDLLCHFHPRHCYQWRVERLADWRQQYDEAAKAGDMPSEIGGATGAAGCTGPLLPSGDAGNYRTPNPHTTHKTYAHLTDDQRIILAIAASIAMDWTPDMNHATGLMWFCYFSHKTEVEEWLSEVAAELGQRQRQQAAQRMQDKLKQLEAHRLEKAAERQRSQQFAQEKADYLRRPIRERFRSVNRNGQGGDHA